VWREEEEEEEEGPELWLEEEEEGERLEEDEEESLLASLSSSAPSSWKENGLSVYGVRQAGHLPFKSLDVLILCQHQMQIR
jgi:hypothetical protein